MNDDAVGGEPDDRSIRFPRDAFHVSEEIARGGPCLACGRFWNEIEPHSLIHREDCTYHAFLNSTSLDFKPIWNLDYPLDFHLEPTSMELAGDYEPAVLTSDLLKLDDEEYAAGRCDPNTHLTHALMLFHKLASDPMFDGSAPEMLWAACCDTVMIWSRG